MNLALTRRCIIQERSCAHNSVRLALQKSIRSGYPEPVITQVMRIWVTKNSYTFRDLG
jgi:hypothetical protein